MFIYINYSGFKIILIEEKNFLLFNLTYVIIIKNHLLTAKEP